MKKLFALIVMFSMLTIGASINSFSQTSDSSSSGAPDSSSVQANTEQPKVDENVNPDEAGVEQMEGKTMHQVIKQKFIEGGAEWMAPILLTLIIGLAIVIERILYLYLSSTNSKKLLSKIESALTEGGIESAKEVCRNTRGPLASIFYQGLDRSNEGIDMVEKSVVAYGSVQTGLLEKGLSWISLMISLAPMLGFLGTVVGMIFAFDSIQAAGDISPSLVAGGIKIALITTVFGLIVAIILQIFYNLLVSKIDSLVNTMEDASISLIDILYKYTSKN